MNPAAPPLALTQNWWPLLALIAFASTIYILPSRSLRLPPFLPRLLERILSFDWLYRYVEITLSAFAALMRVLSRLLEGSAGLLWAFLLIALLLSVLSQWVL